MYSCQLLHHLEFIVRESVVKGVKVRVDGFIATCLCGSRPIHTESPLTRSVGLRDEANGTSMTYHCQERRDGAQEAGGLPFVMNTLLH